MLTFKMVVYYNGNSLSETCAQKVWSSCIHHKGERIIIKDVEGNIKIEHLVCTGYDDFDRFILKIERHGEDLNITYKYRDYFDSSASGLHDYSMFDMRLHPIPGLRTKSARKI